MPANWPQGCLGHRHPLSPSLAAPLLAARQLPKAGCLSIDGQAAHAAKIEPINQNWILAARHARNKTQSTPPGAWDTCSSFPANLRRP